MRSSTCRFEADLYHLTPPPGGKKKAQANSKLQSHLPESDLRKCPSVLSLLFVKPPALAPSPLTCVPFGKTNTNLTGHWPQWRLLLVYTFQRPCFLKRGKTENEFCEVALVLKSRSFLMGA